MSPRAHELLKEYYEAAVEANSSLVRYWEEKTPTRLQRAFLKLEEYITYCESGGS